MNENQLMKEELTTWKEKSRSVYNRNRNVIDGHKIQLSPPCQPCAIFKEEVKNMIQGYMAFRIQKKRDSRNSGSITSFEIVIKAQSHEHITLENRFFNVSEFNIIIVL